MALWDKIETSGNVEDRRGVGSGGIAISGIGGIILFLAFMFLGGQDNGVLDQILGQIAQQSTAPTSQPAEFRGEDSYEVFTQRVLGSNNETWSAIFQARGIAYREPRLVLFRGVTQSGCGVSSAAVGPHYCPVDSTIYLDETFFDDLKKRYGGSNSYVAQAYVISHEVAHHIQSLTGDMSTTLDAQQANPSDANALSVGLELQADCYAGIWMNSLSSEGVLQDREIEEALSAAAAVGDDRIQQQTSGEVNPETWTHGTSEQRMTWFKKGYTTGKVESCKSI